MNVKYSLEKLTDELRREMMPTLEVHRQELSAYEDMVLNPKWEAYYGAMEQDTLRVFTARDTLDDTILGYAVFFLQDNIHYSDFKYGHQDLFYVIQERRGTLIAKKLLEKSEKYLKEEDNVSIIVHHAKLTNKFGKFLEKFGYEAKELMYHKRVN